MTASELREMFDQMGQRMTLVGPGCSGRFPKFQITMRKPGGKSEENGPQTLRIRVKIDDGDYLHVAAGGIWFVHATGALPGEWGGHEDIVVTLDGQASSWAPRWNGNLSDVLQLPIRAFSTATLVFISGRGGAAATSLLQAHGPKAVVKITDYQTAPGVGDGAAIYEIELTLTP